MSEQPPKRKFPWSEAAHKRLKELYVGQAMSASLVAETLSKEFGHPITRHAVIGKLHLLRITRAKPPKQAKPHPHHQGPRKPKRKPVTKKLVVSPVTGSVMRRGTPKAGFIPPEPVVPGVRKVTLMMLNAGDCHWPVTPHAPHFFCGLPSGQHRYCEAHRQASKPQDVAQAVAEIERAAKYAGGDRV